MVATTLRAGSVAIISYATDALAGSANGGDTIRFVLLQPIGAGTQIFFTDRNWNGTSFASGAGEGTFSFVAGADMAAGTVVTISAAQLQAAGIDLSDAGETIYAYQGANADAPSSFLFAIDIADGNLTFEGTELLNTGLTPGLNAVALGGDQGVYQGQGTQVANTQLADIVNTSRWFTSNNDDISGTGYDDRAIVERSGPFNAGDMQLFGAMTGGGQSDAILRIDNDEGANIGSNLARLMRDHPAFVSMEDIAFDLENGVWFAVMNEGTDITRIVRGNIADLFNANQTAVFTTVYEYNNDAADSGDDRFIVGIELDKASDRIFFTLGDIFSGHNFMSVDYNGGNVRDWGPIDLAQNAIGFNGGLEDFVVDTLNNTAYFTYVLVDASVPTADHNYIVRLTAPLDAAAPNPGVENYAIVNLGMPADGNLPAGRLDPAQGSVRGIDYDPGENAIWFVTGRLGAGGTGGIFKYDLDTGVLTEVWEQPSNNAYNSPQAFPTTLLHDIEVDSIGGRYYVTDQASTDVTAAHDGTATDENGGNIWSGSLSGTGAPTLFQKIYEPTANGSVKGMEINYAPTLTAASSAGGAVTEASSGPSSGETTRVAVINSISVNDVDTTAIQGATIAISTGFMSGANQDRLTINDAPSGTVNGIAYSYNASTGVMTLSGSASFATYQTVLALVRFSTSGDNITNFGNSTTRTISFSVHDGLSWSDPAAANVAVTAINDAPVNAVGAAMNFAEDSTANVITGISVSDVDADPATQAITVSFSVANGTLTIRTDVAGGITSGMITGGANGTGSIVVTATQNQINATLAAGPFGLAYNPNANFNGADSLTVVTNDAGYNGNDPGLTGTGTSEQDSDVKTLNVADVNDAPTVGGDGTEDSPTILEDTPFTEANAPTVATLFGPQFSDALDDQDQGGLNPTGTSGDTLAGVAITMNLSSSGTGQWQYWDGASWVNIGSATLNAAKTFSAATQLRFNPDPEYSGAAPTLTARLIESGGPAITNGGTVDLNPAPPTTGAGSVYSSGTVVLSQAVTAVNDAPVVDLNGAAAGGNNTATYTEQGPTKLLASGISVVDIDSATLTGATVQITGGFVPLAGDGADYLGISGSGAGTVNGITYSYSALTGVLTLSGSASVAAYEYALSLVTFQSTTNNPGTSRTITWSVNDGAATSTPVTTTIAVTPVDDPATASGDTATTSENTTVAIAVLANDSDLDGPPPAVTHIAGQAVAVGGSVTLASGATATLNANGTITYDPNGKFNHLVSPAKAATTGASNSSATDSFTYTLVGGASAGVTVTVNGVDTPSDWLQGTAGNDAMTGTSLADIFMLQDGGEDGASGGLGNDGFYLGAALSAGDRLDGGTGTDQVGLQGGYGTAGTPYVFDAASFSNIEMLVLLPGNDARFGDGAGNNYSYFLKTVDANVASGEQLAVSFNTLRVGENVSFDGSAETDGSFLTFGGLGNDTLIGGQQNDAFYFGFNRWGAGDSVDGQGGSLDQLGLQGVYTGANAITFGANQLAGIEMLVLLSGGDARFGSGGAPYSYNIITNDANVASGATFWVSANTLRADETLIFDGSAETDGRFVAYGGQGADVIIGGAGADEIWGRGGADTLGGNAGTDRFVYTAVTDSTAASMDRIIEFGAGDLIDLSAIDADGDAGNGNTAFSYIGNSAFSNVAGQLRAFLDGGVWKVEGDVDGDGVADLVIEVSTASGHELVQADFWL